MKLQTRLSLVVLALFLCGWLIAGVTVYAMEQKSAQEETIHTAEVLLSMAISAGRYTFEEISPLLDKEGAGEFPLPASPSYGSHQLFNRLNKEFQSYSYDEKVINPTNPRDLAEAWQVELIQEFLNNPELKEITGKRSTKTGNKVLYIAQPIQIKEASCLQCHGNPKNAPASLIKTYGDVHGFGWKLNEVLGTRLVSIPISIPQKKAQKEISAYLLLIASIFLVAYTTVGLTVKNWILSPLDTISRLVEQISLSNFENLHFPNSKSDYDEFGKLNKSLNRLLISLERALIKRDNKDQ